MGFSKVAKDVVPSVLIYNVHHHFMEKKDVMSDKVGSEQIDVICVLES